MKLTNSNTPKPDCFIWRASLPKSQNDMILDLLAAFSGVKLKHGKYIVDVSRGNIDSVTTQISTVVDVVPPTSSASPKERLEGAE